MELAMVRGLVHKTNGRRHVAFGTEPPQMISLGYDWSRFRH